MEAQRTPRRLAVCTTLLSLAACRAAEPLHGGHATGGTCGLEAVSVLVYGLE